MKFVLNLLLVLICISVSFGQTAFGTWVNKQCNLSMTLNQDGTFVFTGPYGQATGVWGTQGQIFQMQDATGQITQYTITHFSQNVLQLLDVNDVTINYERQVQPGQIQQTLLAEAQGLQLSNGHIHIGVGIVQFVIGQVLKQSEVDELTQASILEFKTNPQEFLNQMQGLQQSLTTMQSLQDPLQIGTLRQMLIAEFHKGTKPMAEHEKPLLIQIINRYVKVVAFDATNNLALTDKDVEAMIDYVQFSSQLSGVRVTFTADERVQYTKQLINEFSTSPIEQKQFLCSASLAWNLVKGNWQNMNQTQQTQIRENYAGTMNAQNQQGNNGNVTQNNINKLRRENIANQCMFNIMNNMSLQNHATMLNTIENFGGTGNYWEVTDSMY
jgi:hypothetical protein